MTPGSMPEYGVSRSRVTKVTRTPGSGFIANAFKTCTCACPPPSNTMSVRTCPARITSDAARGQSLRSHLLDHHAVSLPIEEEPFVDREALGLHPPFDLAQTGARACIVQRTAVGGGGGKERSPIPRHARPGEQGNDLQPVDLRADDVEIGRGEGRHGLLSDLHQDHACRESAAPGELVFDPRIEIDRAVT